ncbi:hypothetical protein IMZ48_43410, partial [Candidatus Bathyarchaeota archaeon]|nr:hypothetical protein [Candidatus Bathyarchaeota archaeon]
MGSEPADKTKWWMWFASGKHGPAAFMPILDMTGSKVVSASGLGTPTSAAPNPEGTVASRNGPLPRALSELHGHHDWQRDPRPWLFHLPPLPVPPPPPIRRRRAPAALPARPTMPPQPPRPHPPSSREPRSPLGTSLGLC